MRVLRVISHYFASPVPDLLMAELASLVACYTAERTGRTDDGSCAQSRCSTLPPPTEGDRDDVWSMADDRLAQLARPLTGTGGTLSIAPMFAAADLERVHHEPSASALRDARQNSQKTRGVTLDVESTLSATGPIMNILGNTVR